MATIDEFSALWDQMLEDDTIWKGAVDLTSDKLIEVNQQQLLDGKSNTGDFLPQYKSFLMPNGEQYGTFKQKKNPRNGGRWDMDLTGNSFSTMKAQFVGDRHVISGEGHAGAFNRGTLGKGKVKGKLFGVYENDYLKVYREKYLYPLQVALIKAYTGAQ